MEQHAQVAPKRWKREAREWLISIVIAVIAALLIQKYAFAQTYVVDISMQGTLVEGNRLIEDKLSYHFTTPDRGDIVIISGPESSKRLIKRLVALPGDVVDIKDGHLYVNGEMQTEPHAKGVTNSLGLKVPYTVPEGKVFVLGDNREHSQDSRQLGPIDMSSLEGRAVFRLWPIADFGQLK